MATNAELIKSVAELTDRLAAKDQEIEDLKAGGSGNSLELQAVLATKDAELTDVKIQLSEAFTLIGEQNAALSSEQSAFESEVVIVTVDKKKVPCSSAFVQCGRCNNHCGGTQRKQGTGSEAGGTR